MRRVRVIPVLQIEKKKLVKTTKFLLPSYVGDPINALKIFNDKEVDEVVILDIGASRNKTAPDIENIRNLAEECFMPLSYGGGITTFEQAEAIFQSGVEKVIIGTASHSNPSLVTSIAKHYGTQSVIVSVDIKKNFFGRWGVYVNRGKTKTYLDPVRYAIQAQANGAGELLLQNIDREGTQRGFDLEILSSVSSAVNIPVVALGGASSIDDFLLAVKNGASAVAAGHMFIYKGPHKAVLINYPSQENLIEKLYTQI